jgi:hypothetical protein
MSQQLFLPAERVIDTYHQGATEHLAPTVVDVDIANRPSLSASGIDCYDEFAQFSRMDVTAFVENSVLCPQSGPDFVGGAHDHVTVATAH